MLAPVVALLLAQGVPGVAPVAAAPAPADAASPAIADRFEAARTRLLRGELAAAAADLDAIAADPAAREYADRAATLARLARDLDSRGRFVPFAPTERSGAPSRAERGGRAELVLFSTLYGVYAAGATALAADVQNGRTIASLLLGGGGAGLGASLLLTRTGPISSGRADAIDSAALWAGYNGTLLGVIGDANLRVAAGISLASSAAGLTTAALLTREAAPRAGTVATANTGGIWGLASGALVSLYLPTEGHLDAVLGTMLVTADAGIVAGAWLGERYRVSRERALLLDAGAVVGLLGGLAVYAMTGADSRPASATLGLAGLGAGLGSAVWLTRDWDGASDEGALSLELAPWVAPAPDGRVAWGVAGRF